MLWTSPPYSETNSTDVLAALRQLTSIRYGPTLPQPPNKRSLCRRARQAAAGAQHSTACPPPRLCGTTTFRAPTLLRPITASSQGSPLWPYLPPQPFFVPLSIRDTWNNVSHKIRGDRKRTSRRHSFFLTLGVSPLKHTKLFLNRPQNFLVP